MFHFAFLVLSGAPQLLRALLLRAAAREASVATVGAVAAGLLTMTRACAASCAYTFLFLVYLTGTYSAKTCKQCINWYDSLGAIDLLRRLSWYLRRDFSYCCVGTIRLWWLIAISPIAHIMVGALVLIQVRMSPVSCVNECASISTDTR
jgi:hypothetical protein